MRSLIEQAKRQYVFHRHEISQSLTVLLGKKYLPLLRNDRSGKIEILISHTIKVTHTRHNVSKLKLWSICPQINK